MHANGKEKVDERGVADDWLKNSKKREGRGKKSERAKQETREEDPSRHPNFRGHGRGDRKGRGTVEG